MPLDTDQPCHQMHAKLESCDAQHKFSNAIAHAVHEDAAAETAAAAGISAVSTAPREAEGASPLLALHEGGLRTACAQHYALKRGLKY